MSRRQVAAALGVILLLAFVLRLIGLRYGLPAVYNPDEVAITARALAFAKGDLNPHNFLYPSFYFYVLFAWLALSFIVTWLTGAVASLTAFQTQFFVDPTNIYVAGRLLGVTCGTATVALTYLLGKRVATPTTGLMAALFLATTPGNVRDSHYIKHDVPVTLAIVLAQLAILRLPQSVPPRPSRHKNRSTGGGSPAPAIPSRKVDTDEFSPREASTREQRGTGVPPLSGAGEWIGDGCPPTPTFPSPREGVPGERGRGEGSGVVLAGAACGVACSIHYYAVFLAVPLVLAIWFSARGGGARVLFGRIVLAGLAAAAVFFALSPFLLIEPGTAVRDILANRQIVVDRAVGHRQVFGNLGAYLQMLWGDAGWPVCLAAILGAVVLVRERGRVAFLLLSFPVVFLLFISNTVAASRYLDPVFPVCAVLAALAVTRLLPGGAVRVALAPSPAPGSVSGLPAAGRQVAVSGRAGAFPWLVALLISLVGLVQSVRLDLFFRQADTRTLAQSFIEQHVPPGSTVLVQPYSVVLTQSRDSLVEALRAHQVDPARASTKFALRLALDPYPAPAYRTLYLGEGGLDQDKIYLGFNEAGTGEGLRRAGVQYVVLKRYNTEDPAVEPLRARLVREGRLLTTISPYQAGADAATRARVAPFLHNTDTPYDPALERPGPGIEVWQVAQ